MANGAEKLKSDVEISLSKSILQHCILNTNPIYQSNNKHNNRVKEKKPFHKIKKLKLKKKNKNIKYMRTRIGHVA